jgi:uncharacterized protein YoxC
MQKFQFQVVDAEGKNLSGYILAKDEDAAKEKLTDNGLAILSIEDYLGDEKPTEGGLPIFEFRGTDDNGKEARGTVEAKGEYLAYKKLVLDYDFTLTYLAPRNFSNEEKKERKEKGGISDAVRERFGKDKVRLLKKKGDKESQKKRAEEAKEDEMADAIHDKEDEMEFVQGQIKAIITEAEGLLHKNQNFLDPEKKREIKERIDLLSRLQHSNSIAHLQRLTQRLLDELSSDAIFIKNKKHQAEIEAGIGEFRGLSEKFENKLNKRLASIQIEFSDIDTERIREVVDQLNPMRRILPMVYDFFVFLGGLLVIFLFLNFVGAWFEATAEQSIFFLKSALLFYATTVSLLVTGYFGWLSHKKQLETFKQRMAFSGIFALLVAIITLEFPAIFFWT